MGTQITLAEEGGLPGGGAAEEGGLPGGGAEMEFMALLEKRRSKGKETQVFS